MSALLLIHRDGNQIVEVPFVYKSGEMLEVIENMSEYIVASGLGESFWETVAGERMGVILKLQLKLNGAMEVISQQAADLAMFGVMGEAAGKGSR